MLIYNQNAGRIKRVQKWVPMIPKGSVWVPLGDDGAGAVSLAYVWLFKFSTSICNRNFAILSRSGVVSIYVEDVIFEEAKKRNSYLWILQWPYFETP